MNTDLKGNVALITGASGGIGKTIATRLSSMGMHLVITGRNDEKLENIEERNRKTRN